MHRVRQSNATHIAPLVSNHFTVPGRPVRFSVSCFAGSDWSLKDMYESQDAYRHPQFAERLGSAFAGLGAYEVYAPTPTKFNGEVALRRDLTTAIHLPYGVSLYRNREVFADGTFLSAPGQAGTFSAGGCGVIKAACEDDLIMAHAGRESIIDRRRVPTRGAEENRSKDLIDHLLVNLGDRPRETMHFWPLYFIGPDEFVHDKDATNPDHAAYNKAAMEYLPREFPGEFGWVTENAIGIDLARIFRAQAVKRGVPPQNVHLEHADLNKELPTTRKGGGRYLVVGVRKP